jgi:hypothetical protein
VTLLAIDYPPWEYVLLVVALLLGLINKAVEFSKKIRQRSIDAEKQADAQFGAELGEAPEPPRAEAPPARLELLRRPARPRREEPPAPEAPPPPRPAPVAAPPKPRREHEIVRLLRTPQGARNAVILAEVLRRYTARGTFRPNS